MRAALGPAFAHLALLGAGFGVLELSGHLRDLPPWRLLAAAGLAYMAGVATVMTTLIVALVVGVPLSLLLFATICVLLAVPFAARLVRRSTWREWSLRPRFRQLRELGVEGWVVVAIVSALAVIAIVGLASLAVRPLSGFDAWLIWTRKAVALFYFDGLPDELVQERVNEPSHWDYPLLLPLLEAMQFRAGGRPVVQHAHLASWLLLIGFVWGAAFVVRRSVKPIVWAAVLGGTALLVVPLATTAYADVPMACFLGLGALALGLWIESGRTSDLVLASIMLAGAASTKNEGLVGAVIVLGVGLAVQVGWRDWRRVVPMAAAGLAVAVTSVMPWRIWLAAHDVPSTTPLRQGLDPGYLADQSKRVGGSVTALYDPLVGLDLATLLLPAAIALILLRFRSLPRIAFFYLAVGLLYFASLVWAYVVSPLELGFLTDTSASRVYVGVVFIALAAVLQLTGDLPRRHDASDLGDKIARAPASHHRGHLSLE